MTHLIISLCSQRNYIIKFLWKMHRHCAYIIIPKKINKKQVSIISLKTNSSALKLAGSWNKDLLIREDSKIDDGR